MEIDIAVVCGAFFGLIALMRRGRASLCLPVAYLVNLLLIHLPGALAHSGSGGEFSDPTTTIEGFRLTAYGVVAFLAGVAVLRLAASRRAVVQVPASDTLPGPVFLLAMGWIFLLVVLPVASRIPSVSAVVHGASSVWILGVILGLQTQPRKWPLWLAAILLYPAYTLLVMGFMGYGILGLTLCLAPLLRWWRQRFLWIPVLVLCLYAGMSFYLSYVRSRTLIRDAVWGEESFANRVEAAALVVTEMEPMSLSRVDHFQLIDSRLNQNDLVGEASLRLRRGDVDFLYGKSLVDALAAMVPRLVWPDKPAVAGSGDFVSNRTGRRFAEGTSVGVGNVLEFDANFGVAGVVGGFFLLGLAIAALDHRAAAALESGRTDAAIVPFLIAVALCQPGGSMVELSASALSAWIAGHGWAWWLRMWGDRKENAES